MDETPLPGEWKETRPGCACDCSDEIPEVQVWVAFGDSGDFINVGTSETEDTPSAAKDNPIRVQFRYDPTTPPRPFKLRYRQLTITQDGSSGHAYTIGAEAELVDPGGVGLLTTGDGFDSIALTSDDDHSTVSIVGPEFKPVASIIGVSAFAALTKRGFAAYTGDENETATIYRQELVDAASAPGCPALGMAAQDFSGAQKFTALNGDPSGAYADTTSRDLRRAGYASSPIGFARRSKRFGVVTDSATVREMSAPFICGDTPQTKTLRLALADEYTTSELTDAVDALIAAQFAAGAQAYTGTPVVALQYLSPGETYYSKRKSNLAIPCPAPRGVYLDPGAGFEIVVRYKRRLTSMSTGTFSDTDQTVTFECMVPAPPIDFAPPIGRQILPVLPQLLTEGPTAQTLTTLVDFSVDSQPYFSGPLMLEYLEPAT